MAAVSGSTKAPRHAPEIRTPAEVDPIQVAARFDRDEGLEALIDRLAGEVILRHAPGRHVLDLGHGSDAVTQWIERRAASQRVVDAVDLGRSDVRLPFGSASFDLVYSLRTLAHLGRDGSTSEEAARSALREIARVLRPGGTALVQLENPRSLWGVYHGLRNVRHAVEAGPLVVESNRGLTRFDTLSRLEAMLPPQLGMTRFHGLGIVAVVPGLLDVPVLGRLARAFEWFARDRAGARGFAAHLLVELRRVAELPTAHAV